MKVLYVSHYNLHYFCFNNFQEKLSKDVLGQMVVNYTQQLHFSSLLRDIDKWMDWLQKGDKLEQSKVKDKSLVSLLLLESTKTTLLPRTYVRSFLSICPWFVS